MLLVGNLQVKVVTGEDPVGFRGNQTRRIDTQRSDHTFKLIHGLVLISGLEWCHE